jgi:hypothetical protein
VGHHDSSLASAPQEGLLVDSAVLTESLRSATGAPGRLHSACLIHLGKPLTGPSFTDPMLEPGTPPAAVETSR